MSGSNVTCDTSVLVSALRPTQPGHTDCLAAIGNVDSIAAHVLLETYSVLTRLPGAHRVPERPLARVLSGLEWAVLQLPGDEYLPLIQRLGEARFAGGASYDALVAQTAVAHGCSLLTRDRRATRTYDLVGVDHQFI